MRYSTQSSRQQKVANSIRQSLVEIIARGRRLDFRLIENKITFTDIKVSPDLKHANCYYLPFGGNSKLEAIKEGFEASKYAIRQQVTESVNLKYSPELKFLYDSGAENAIDVEQTLKNLTK